MSTVNTSWGAIERRGNTFRILLHDHRAKPLMWMQTHATKMLLWGLLAASLTGGCVFALGPWWLAVMAAIAALVLIVVALNVARGILNVGVDELTVFGDTPDTALLNALWSPSASDFAAEVLGKRISGEYPLGSESGSEARKLAAEAIELWEYSTSLESPGAIDIRESMKQVFANFPSTDEECHELRSHVAKLRDRTTVALNKQHDLQVAIERPVREFIEREREHERAMAQQALDDEARRERERADAMARMVEQSLIEQAELRKAHREGLIEQLVATASLVDLDVVALDVPESLEE